MKVLQIALERPIVPLEHAQRLRPVTAPFVADARKDRVDQLSSGWVRPFPAVEPDLVVCRLEEFQVRAPGAASGCRKSGLPILAGFRLVRQCGAPLKNNPGSQGQFSQS